MIANLQYGWTLFVNPIEDKHHWGLPAIQVAFTIFVVVETWLVPLEGYAVDKFGPKLVGVGSGILVAAAWTINAYADTLPLLYLGAIVGGIGAGGVYGACVGNALKWFPDRRGLAAGITAMGFGAGSALTVYPIANMIQSQGYEAAFLKFGVATDPLGRTESRQPYSLLTVSLLRPLARRRFSTRRPFLLLIRTRKPCVRLRWRVLG